jgi:predicted DNA-binding protein
MPETIEQPAVRLRFARADLPDPEYQRLKKCADRERRSIASYIRNAIVDRIQADEAESR